MDGAVRLDVPAHITGFFSVHPAEDPLRAGSRGAGVTLADAVSVSIRASDGRSVRLNDRETSIPAVSYVLEELDASVSVDATASVPVGSGFGVSGAVALGTAFGVNRLRDRERPENELVGIAHAGDVTAGTGLGDVVAQHRGGAPIRLEPGAPPHGELDGIPDSRPIEWTTLGELSTEAILAGDTGSIDRAGAHALERLQQEPTLERLIEESVAFARETGLLTDPLEAIIEDVNAAGGSAAMAMLGQTVFALDDGLSRAGYDAAVRNMASGGVRFVPEDDDPR